MRKPTTWGTLITQAGKITQTSLGEEIRITSTWVQIKMFTDLLMLRTRGYRPEKKEPSFQETVMQKFQATETRFQNIESRFQNMENQLGQIINLLGQRQPGTLPSQPEVNPKEQVKAITVRSDREIEMPVRKEEEVVVTENHQVPTEGSTLNREKGKEKAAEKVSIKPYQPKIPFPQRLKSNRNDPQFAKFMEVLKELKINVPFVEAISQMPKYAKFLKEILSNKRKLEEFEIIKLNEECSAVILQKLPQKLKDPGSFTIPCTIGDTHFDRALCDLGASINLMPLSVFRRLGMQEPKPTTISLQLADRSITYPRGIVEDVLVKVDKFIFPADFIVLDMEEDEEIPIILGRPFLATGRTIIDVQQGKLTLRLDDEEVVFKVFNSLRQPSACDSCNRINTLDASLSLEAGTPKVRWKEARHFEGLECKKTAKLKSSIEEPPERELKQPPSNLRYDFSPPPSSLPVIISSNLSGTMEEQSQPRVQPQGRLNPSLKEKVKKEVIQLHDARIIYPISGIPWVSPVQVVLKKGDTTVKKRKRALTVRKVYGWRVKHYKEGVNQERSTMLLEDPQTTTHNSDQL